MADRDPNISLGQFTERAERHLDGDAFESVDEVLAAAFDALDRERAERTRRVRALVQEALDDPRPALPIDEAFAEIYARIAERRAG